MSAGADRGGVRISLALLVYLAAFISTLALAHPVLTDQDPFWHIAAGNWIIEHRAIPDRDVFSNSMPGAPWIAHEWLAEVAIALVYDYLGWAGLVVMTGMIFSAALALLTRFLLRFLAPIHVVPLVLGAWGLCLAHLHARPHVFGLPLLVMWFAVLDRQRLEERVPSMLLAAIIALWANLHGGYMLGLALGALLAGEALLDAPDRPRFMTLLGGWGGFLLVAILAAFLTPNGIRGLTLPFTVMQSSFAGAMIGEWKSPDFQTLQPLELWMLLGLLGIMSFGLRLPIARIVILFVVLHMALAHQRFAEVLGLIAPLLIAPELAMQLGTAGDARLRGFASALVKPASPIGVALAALAVAVIGAAFMRLGIDNQDHRFAPTAAVAFVKQQQVAGAVFNDYEFGGYLIFSGIAPFVDGRADIYGDDFLRRYANVAALPDLLDQYRIGWTLLERHDPRATLIDHLPGWQRIYGDDIAVVHRRTAAIP
ncbi:MAG TPA: hypothetical protein VG291_13215 [Xanthobacteraceae bacterium]|nr:hypothetical protein [Xanthobacteraceae bacterium]